MVNDLRLDLQLRENDTAMLYCGLSRLVVAKYHAVGEQGFVRLSAHRTYRDQTCAKNLFRDWRVGEDGLAHALEHYLRTVNVSSRHTGREGGVQAAWMAVTEPWHPLDREAVLGDSRPLSKQAQSCIEEAFTAIRRHARIENWVQPDAPKAANEVDQLAVDTCGRLVVVELKHATGTGFYYAPWQVLRYAWEWAEAVDDVCSEIEDLIMSKQSLGLLSTEISSFQPKLRVAGSMGRKRPFMRNVAALEDRSWDRRTLHAQRDRWNRVVEASGRRTQ